MTCKIECVETETWHRVIEELEADGFEEISRYDGFDAGIDYNRFELRNRDGELVICEWDNWAEGEIRGEPERLEALRQKYQLHELVEIEE